MKHLMTKKTILLFTGLLGLFIGVRFVAPQASAKTNHDPAKLLAYAGEIPDDQSQVLTGFDDLPTLQQLDSIDAAKEQKIEAILAKEKPVAVTKSREGEPLYVVVAGTFGFRENAEREVSKMKNLGFDHAYSFRAANPKYYSVSAGKYRTQIEAKNVAKSLEDKDFPVMIMKK